MNYLFGGEFVKKFKKEIDSFEFNKLDLKELFEVFYVIENYMTVITQRTLPKIFDEDEDPDYVSQRILSFEFIKPLSKIRKSILKDFTDKSDERMQEFKQSLLDEKIFEIPKIFKELKYIFNGLISILLHADSYSDTAQYTRDIIRNFITKIILNASKDNAEGFIMTISSKTVCLIRDFYINQRKITENKQGLQEENELIKERLEFLEYCLKLSTEREIWWKLGMDHEDHSYESIQEFVNLLKTAYDKLRWVPLKLNTLLHFNDYDIKQLIAEEAKNNVIMKLNELLQELVEYCDDAASLQTYEGMGIELIESIRKKIVY